MYGAVGVLMNDTAWLFADGPEEFPTNQVVPPVRIADGVVLEDCEVGPNVTLEPGATIRRSTVRSAIVGERACITDATVEHSLVGDDAVVEGGHHRGMVVAKDEAAPAR